MYLSPTRGQLGAGDMQAELLFPLTCIQHAATDAAQALLVRHSRHAVPVQPQPVGPVAAELRQLLDQLMAGKSAADFCRLIESDLMNDELGIQPLKRLLNLMLLIEKYERRNIPPELSLPEDNHGRNTSIHQPTYRSSL